MSTNSEDEQRPNRHWWETLPGVLAGIAAVLVAVTGLWAAIHNGTDWSYPDSVDS